MPKDTLALLLVLCQLYAETSMIPFTQNTFLAVDAGRLRYLLCKNPRGTSASISRVNNLQIHCTISVDDRYGSSECSAYANYPSDWSLTRFTGLKHITILTHIELHTYAGMIQAEIEKCQQDLAKLIKSKCKVKDLMVSFEDVTRRRC
jgi:hypothetical protein